MNLILDVNNHIIGVDEANGNYQYEGYMPDDFDEHQSDGYYMIADNIITQVPVLADGETIVEQSSMSKQINNLTMLLAISDMKGSGE